jgi:hypothetical protein
MALRPILWLLLIILLIGALPAWPYSANWGYFPSGIFGLLILLLVVGTLFGGGRRGTLP